MKVLQIFGSRDWFAWLIPTVLQGDSIIFDGFGQVCPNSTARVNLQFFVKS